MAVTLYRQVGKGKARRYQKVHLGRGRRPTPGLSEVEKKTWHSARDPFPYRNQISSACREATLEGQCGAAGPGIAGRNAVDRIAEQPYPSVTRDHVPGKLFPARPWPIHYHPILHTRRPGGSKSEQQGVLPSRCALHPRPTNASLRVLHARS